jgi:lysozyme family protein
MIGNTPDLLKLWNTMIIHENKKEEIIHVAKKILENKSRYNAVAEKTGIPWYVIGIIHNRESSLSFTRHLHNGDTLEHRTIHVPAGRPRKGEPPFTWEDSAVDALQEIEIEDKTHVWSITNMLYQLESYNGFGYRKHSVNTPYVWSFTDHYTKGKFVEVFDAVKQKFVGMFNPNVVDEQIGAAPLIRYLTDRTLGLV